MVPSTFLSRPSRIQPYFYRAGSSLCSVKTSVEKPALIIVPGFIGSPTTKNSRLGGTSFFLPTMSSFLTTKIVVPFRKGLWESKREESVLTRDASENRCSFSVYIYEIGLHDVGVCFNLGQIFNPLYL